MERNGGGGGGDVQLVGQTDTNRRAQQRDVRLVEEDDDASTAGWRANYVSLLWPPC